MDASIALIPRLIFTLISCFMVVIFSIYQIIELAKPTHRFYSQSDSTYLRDYSTIAMMASTPNQDYNKFIGELSARFPSQPDIALKLNISPDIANLPTPEQGNAIRLRLLETRVAYLQNELTKLSESQPESLLSKLSFYFWGLLIWIGSVIIGRILEHLTDKFNFRYLGDNT